MNFLLSIIWQFSFKRRQEMRGVPRHPSKADCRETSEHGDPQPGPTSPLRPGSICPPEWLPAFQLSECTCTSGHLASSVCSWTRRSVEGEWSAGRSRQPGSRGDPHRTTSPHAVGHRELYSMLCGDLNGKEVQKGGDTHTHTHTHIYGWFNCAGRVETNTTF